MLGSLKKLFFKDTSEDLATSIPEVVTLAPDTHGTRVSSESAAIASTPVNRAPAVAPAPATVSSDLVALPMASVLARLPNSLVSVVQSQGNGFIALPARRIAQELPKGSVKITFGELRQAAPPGTFFDNARLDHVLVELPLNEILARLHPSLLSRRSDQKQIQIAADITNVFGPRGEGIMVSTPPPSAPKAVTTPPLRHVGSGDTSISMRNIVRPAAPATPASNVASKPAVTAVPSLRVVESQLAPSQNTGPLVVSLALLCEGWPEMVRAEIGELNLLNAKVALPLDKLEGALKAGKIIFTWKQICEWMQPPINSVSGAQETTVELPLRIIAPLFMAKHRPKVQKKVSISEMPDLFTAQTKVESPEPQSIPITSAPSTPIAFTAPVVPVAAPAPVAPAPAISIQPVAPPAAPKPAPVEPKLTIAPELKMVEPVAPPVEIKMPVAPKVKPSVLGEIFGQPSKQDWTPNEIVKSLAGLPEIAGAFVAMQDGLLVAAQLPSHFTADTVAAFLPQIFGRMNQYTKELKLGGLTSLTFVVENISWQIIKSGTVYLVALGKSGESLPGPKLNTVAAELGKQIQ